MRDNVASEHKDSAPRDPWPLAAELAKDVVLRLPEAREADVVDVVVAKTFLDAMNALPLEQRMEAMGMEPFIRRASGEPVEWVEAK